MINLRKNILFKRIILLVFLIIGLSISGLLWYIYHKSIQMDKNHLEVFSISSQLENSILESRIIIDELYLKQSSDNIQNLQQNIQEIEKQLTRLNEIYIFEFTQVKNNDLNDFKSTYHQILTEYKAFKQFSSNQTEDQNLNLDDLLVLHRKFSTSYQELDQYFQRYLYDNTQIYKKGVFTVLIAALLLLIVAVLIILRLINQLIRYDARRIKGNIEVELRERKRIAADLHDGLGAYLSSMILHLELLGKKHETNPDLVKQSANLSQLARNAIQSVEEIINNLNPSQLTKFGLISTLQKQFQKINALGTTQFTIESKNLCSNLNQSIELMLYRICMELMNNALKHSQAKEAQFNLKCHRNKILLNYHDNGIGFLYKENNENPEKTGLHNLRQRVESFGGRYQIQSALSEGVHIKIELNFIE